MWDVEMVWDGEEFVRKRRDLTAQDQSLLAFV